MTASLCHRWDIVPPVDPRDSRLPGVRLPPRGRPVQQRVTRWNHLNRNVQTLGKARDRQEQLTGNAALPASTVTPAVVALGRVQDRRSLRPFGVAEDEL